MAEPRAEVFRVEEGPMRAEEMMEADTLLMVEMLGDLHSVKSLESKAAILGRIGTLLQARYDTIIHHDKLRPADRKMPVMCNGEQRVTFQKPQQDDDERS